MFSLFAILVVLPATSMGQAIDMFAVTQAAFRVFNLFDENNDEVLNLPEMDDWFHHEAPRVQSPTDCLANVMANNDHCPYCLPAGQLTLGYKILPSCSERLDLFNIGNATHYEFKAYVDNHYPDLYHYEGALYDAIDFNHDTFITMHDIENDVEQADKNNDTQIFQSEFIGYFAQLFMGLELLVEIEDYLTTPSM